MKYLKKFESKSESFEPIPIIHKFSIYYKIYVDKSIDKFDIALTKLGIKSFFYDNYSGSLRKIIKNDIINLVIIDNFTFFIEKAFDLNSFDYYGEIHIDEYEVDSKKYNL